jgi:hypothetical protein
MPSKKQRRRREKTFRHEYGFVTYDEDGNEVEVASEELRPEKPAKAKVEASAKGKGKSSGSSRALRPAPAPSWRRAIKRGSLWGGGMLLLAVFFFKGMPLPTRIGLGAMYALAFIPLTYWIDRTAYRSYLKKSGKTPPS